jgi:hypothetical protein
MPFCQPEYERAFTAFIEQTIDAFVDADEVLGRVQRRRTSGPLAVGPSEGEVQKEQLVDAGDAVAVDVILNVDVISFQTSLGLTAQEYVEQMRTFVVGQMSAGAAAAGNTIDTGEQPLGWDVVIDMFERVPWGADESGLVREPDIVLTRTGGLAALGERTPEQQERVDGVRATKQSEHDAGRRSRRIP